MDGEAEWPEQPLYAARLLVIWTNRYLPHRAVAACSIMFPRLRFRSAIIPRAGVMDPARKKSQPANLMPDILYEVIPDHGSIGGAVSR